MSDKKKILICYNLIISVCLLGLINFFDLRESYGLMLVYGFNSAIVFGSLFILEIKFFSGLSLNLPLLVGYFSRLVVPTITNAIDMIGGERFYFLLEENGVNDYLFPTAVWINIYYMIFYWCINKYAKEYSLEDSIRPFFNRFFIPKFTIPIFTIGIIYNIVTSYIPPAFIPSMFNMIFGKFTLLAIFAQMFDSLFNPTRGRKRLFLFFIIISIWQTLVFGFYKGVIMMNIVYYILYYFLDRKYNNRNWLTLKFLMACVSVLLIIDIIIYPFMTTKRIVAGWDPTAEGIATQDYSNWRILVDVINGNSIAERGDNTASGRMDALPANAFFYKECCEKGLRTSEVAINNLELLVPRFVNPNKHGAEAGKMAFAYAMYGSFKHKDYAVSNNYIGQFASAYIIGGWFAVLLSAYFVGRFVITYYNFLINHNNNLLALICLILLLLNSIMAFEEVHDGGLLFMGYNTVMMIIIYLTSTFAYRLFCIRKG